MADDTRFNWGWIAIALVSGIAIGVVAYWLSTRTRSQQAQAVYAAVPKYRNTETWRWTDWRGRDRMIAVEREVKTSV